MMSKIEEWILTVLTEAIEWVLMVRDARLRIGAVLDDLEARTVDISAEVFARRTYPSSEFN